MEEEEKISLTDEEILSIAGRIKGRRKTPAKTAANPLVASRLKTMTEAAVKANTRPLEEIACCGRDPHLKSCLRFKAMVRRGIA